MDNSLPTIRLTFSDHRINIAKSVLYAIGSPTHIQILISPDNKAMYIRKCADKVFDRFAVPPRVYIEGAFRFAMQKAAFTEALLKRLHWDKEGVYRIAGVALSDDAMEFRFDKAEKLGVYKQAKIRRQAKGEV